MMSKFKNIIQEAPVQFKDMIDYKENRIISHSICDTDHTSIVIFSLDQGEVISDETTPGSECFTVLEGRIHFSSGASAHELREGDSIIVPPNVSHSLEAIEQSKFLQISVNG